MLNVLDPAAVLHPMSDLPTVLQACLRAYWQGGPWPDLSALKDPVGLVHLAAQQGVGPLLYRALKAAPSQEVPEQLRGVLRPAFLAAAAQASMQVREVQRLQQAFEAAGVPVLFYKGVVLGQMAYGDPVWRPAADIDGLIQPEMLERAEAILLRMGYRRDVPHRGMTRRVYLCFQREHPYRTPDRLLMVDLHLSVAPWRFAPVQGGRLLWKTAVPVTVGGRTVWTLAPEALMPLVCLHSAKHQWRSLKWINDVVGLLQAFPALDWEQVWQWARRWQCVRMVRLGLWLAHEVLGASLRPEVLRMVHRDAGLKQLAQRVSVRLGRPEAWDSFWHRFVFHVQSREHVGARLRYLVLSGLFYTVRPLLGIQH